MDTKIKFEKSLADIGTHLPPGVLEGLLREFKTLTFPEPIVQEKVRVVEKVVEVMSNVDRIMVAELRSELKHYEMLAQKVAQVEERLKAVRQPLINCLPYLKEYGPRSVYQKIEAIIEVLNG